MIEVIPNDEAHFDEWCTDCKEYDHEKHCCPRWNRVIRETLKDAQPMRKKGRWIVIESDSYGEDYCKCSVCGRRVTTMIHQRENFCPDCGADMREDCYD